MMRFSRATGRFMKLGDCRRWRLPYLFNKNLKADISGVAAIETALVLPLLFLIGFGGMELANYVLIHSRLSQVALTVADNASRIGATTGQVREVDIQEIFTGARLQGQGIDWDRKGRIILSSLEERTINGVKTQTIRWQRCLGGLSHPSTYGSVGENLGASSSSTSGMGPSDSKIRVSPGTAIMFVELAYQYEPSIMPQLFGSRKLVYTAAFNVREARNLDAGTDGIIQVGNSMPCTTTT